MLLALNFKWSYFSTKHVTHHSLNYFSYKFTVRFVDSYMDTTNSMIDLYSFTI
jgi:hypothetical protein